ncbi:hypothetical protein M9H77_07418 [Catharanthus roseus]|uniref:Uncharacterized protein n=1 Tax=Catharanthus roseus TaxID=4058 RepID=A0ACC0BVA0_CATRO|nr:hypothetical protein M9H77_07418 [Catharanthus roseus]
MVAFIEDTMKNGLKRKNEGKLPKLLMIHTISKEYSIELSGRTWPPSQTDPAGKRGFKTSKLNMEDDLCHVQQALEGLEQQLSCLGKGVKDLRREEEIILEQSSGRNLAWEKEVEPCSIPIV